MTAVQDPTSIELSDMMATLRQVHATGRTRSLEWRMAQLDGLARLCEERESEMVAALVADLGRDAFEAWFGDIASSKSEVDFARKHLKRWMKPQRQRMPLNQLPGSARVQYEPLGVVLIIAPWNYPIFLSLSPIVAALAAGNCVVLKPSELAPATSAVLADLLPRYLDPEAVKVVEGDGIVTQDLLTLGFDHALFTGGTEIGRKIMAGAAATLTPVTLELGGKSPVIVAADADLDVVGRRLAWVKMLNSGQTCIAPDYVMVQESVKDALVASISKALADQQVERPEGLRIVNERQFARLASGLQATKGTVARGGDTDADRLLIEPTVIVDPDPDEPLMTDEIFGPVLPVMGYRTEEEAVAFINARPKPLAMYVFSKDLAKANRLVELVPAGGAVVNHVAVHCLVPTLPFGGVGASGMGDYHGKWGFQTFSHRKAVLVKRQSPDPKMTYPPYGERARKLMRRLF